MLARVLGEDITLELTCDPDVPLVRADPRMMEQVIMNLALNARDAMPEGGRLEIGTHVLDLAPLQAHRNPHGTAGCFACMEVTDSGCGIAADHLPHIFDPFFTTKEVGKGTGLGLASVYGIVMQHNGWIEATSAPGTGATFRVMLPAAAHAEQPRSLETPPAPVPAGHETILLVEDDKSICALVAEALRQAGYTVRSAATGVLALEIWKQHAMQIDAVITDVVMPGGVSGLRLAEELEAQRPGLCVIYASGYSPQPRPGQVELIEGFNYIQKPFALDAMLRLLRSRLDSGSTV
jgi:CheY-like chemotaxis protein